MITVGSLFSGAVDGMSIAFSVAGADVRWHVEIDAFNRRILEKHRELWKHSAIHADVRDVGIANLEPVDIIVGGFPCQDVSLAGSRAGMGEGTRSGLWSEFRRIISELKPSVVVIENVPGILASIKGHKLAMRVGRLPFIHAPNVRAHITPPPLFEVARQLAEMGYVGSWGTISAADAGAPHLRNRVFVVGYADRIRHSQPRNLTNPVSDIARDITPLKSARGTIVHAPIADGEIILDYANGSRFEKSEIVGIQSQSGDLGGRFGTPLPDAASEVKRHQRRVADQTWSDRQPTGSPQRRQRNRANKPRMGGNIDGITPRLDGWRGYPNPPGLPPAPHEPPRLVTPPPPLITKRMAALGNAVQWTTFYPIAWHLATFMEETS